MLKIIHLLKKKILKESRYINIEVADSKSSSKIKNRNNRKEFYVDHLHIFTTKLLADCIKNENFKSLKIDKTSESCDKLLTLLQRRFKF